VAALLDDGQPAGAAEGEPRPVHAPPRPRCSPWASKATDIAPATALSQVLRVRRASPSSALTPARRRLLGGDQAADPGTSATPLAALLHDRMTESVAFERDAAARTCSTRAAGRAAWRTSTCSGADAPRWRRPTPSFGLALSDDEIDYLGAGLHRAWAATRPTSS
jgi:phosphoribosylformylglycinamidine synthase